ncbi:MAG: hypothetical protein OZ913_06535 [Ignavibacteriaceae bacterium]|nr:MAG: hypothetical protein EDM69_06515 [Chlorobiota bacterium]MBV6399156.1 hypothetical protein [Ignavibacteria bacterium]MCC6885397.1 hypothetical protein [Ignavibacteriales bacterium]MCE7953640.1 hypothetical protein [Chlorobi bacterium CHB7]MDL1887470.1 hypothetical protein [Ignavibacteria bacterium CHB1]MEB2329944.1 hypothetical protein [Ignavibacteriaceae bacterium]RIK49175.1 MAG: hypothetical protein DCC60_04300 [Ignavibacteriota bacterium]
MGKSILLTKFFISQTLRDKDNNSFRKIVGILLIYLISNFILSYNFYITFTKTGYIFLTISLALFFLGFMLLNDFRNIFFLNRDNRILASMPISMGDLTISKIISGFLFSFALVIVLLIPSAFFYYQYSNSIVEVFLYTLILFEFTITVTFILMLLFALSFKLSGSSTFLFIIFQIIFFVFIFISTGFKQELPGVRLDIESINYLRFFPQMLYAKSIEQPVLILFTTILTFVTILFTVFFISKNILSFSDNNNSKIKTGYSGIKQFTGFCVNSTLNFFCSNRYQKAFYQLTFELFTGSRDLSLKFLSLMLMPVIFSIIGLFLSTTTFQASSMPDGFPWKPQFDLLSPAVIILLLFSMFSLMRIMKTSDPKDKNTQWLFHITNIQIKDANAGSFKFLTVFFLIPVVSVVSLIAFFNNSPVSLFLNLLFIASVVLLTGTLYLKTFKEFPFTKNAGTENPFKNFLPLLSSLGITIIVFIVQIFTFQNIIFVISASVIFFIIAILILKK